MVSKFRNVQTYLSKHIKERVVGELGYLPISKTMEQDIFVVGYPKSGNTWFQNIIASVLFGMVTEFVPDVLVQELIPDVHHKKYYKRYTNTTFFKSHYLPQPEYRRVIYLIRDGRDALVSYFHYLDNFERKNVDKLQAIRHGNGLIFGKWSDHVEKWTANPYNADLIVIRYEDMKQDLVKELKKICLFASLDRQDDYLIQVSENVTFDKMRRQEQRFGWDRPKWPKDQSFIRRGIVGSHKDELNAYLYQEFLEDAKNTLTKFGYAT